MAETEPLTALRAALLASQESPRTAPVRVHNRLATAIQKQCEVLAQTSEGRAALSAAADADPDPQLRLVAATTIQRWDVDRARATLEDLVVQSGGTVVRPMTMSAALAVSGQPGESAALCLLNLDHPRPTVMVTDPKMSHTAVASELLDAAERVYNLAMNGGIDHAYEVAGEQFPAAAEACDAVGAHEQADVLREVVALVAGVQGIQGGLGPAAALRALNEKQDRQLQGLNERYCVPDDLMERLEGAAEV